VRALVNPRHCPPRLLLTGGVTRSERIRAGFRAYAAEHGMEFLEADATATDYLDALGAALLAARMPASLPSRAALIRPPVPHRFETVPALSGYLGKVRRLTRQAVVGRLAAPERLVVGFDIGSTGSKVVAVDVARREPVWESYLATAGDPVGAAKKLLQRFLDGPVGAADVAGFGCTGSGREIVGSLIASCVGEEHVYVLNEIAAHAEGALYFDPRVDTIFEIGGQDAKYIRLAQGRVVDAAMNEACSAGTGSFIEEQGRKFAAIQDITQLGHAALDAPIGLSLGQHCSVFMAEVIDDAVAAGTSNSEIIAGIYDSVIQNYLNRVKGSRTVGQVIFCQGMPFAADALAAAVVRQTSSEVVVPPNPGTVGALGIALLARRLLPDIAGVPVDPRPLLAAEVRNKDAFVCGSTRGCGTPGNRCRIDRLHTRIGKREKRFTWGGACSLWDRGTGRVKLPDLTPDPFRERARLLAGLRARLAPAGNRPRIGLTDEFALKGLYPFFATFFDRLGFAVHEVEGDARATLKRGIEEATIPFCAPLQFYHGVISRLAEAQPEFLFVPMLRSLPPAGEDAISCTCPVVQGSADVISSNLRGIYQGRILSPVLDLGAEELGSAGFVKGLAGLAAELGVAGDRWRSAYEAAVAAQHGFERAVTESGRQALAFCRDNGLVAVVVLGRPYTIYNSVLNSNVPALLREQGAVAIPVDAFEVDDDTPTFGQIYWSHSQHNLRAVCQVRATPGVYGLWASNYSCGPDSFNLHFYAHLMAGKPYAVIETDGHTGDAGTKTRVEAFLHCVREDLAAMPAPVAVKERAALFAGERVGLSDIRDNGETVLVPRMGEGAELLCACLRGAGVAAEALPRPDRDALRRGRRHTSGKECVPMAITLGSLLQRIEHEPDPLRRFTFLMPTTEGPCRFGVYHHLHRLVTDQLGYGERLRIWSPGCADNYFAGMPAGFSALTMAGFAAGDVLLEALHECRPGERTKGAAEHVYRRYYRLLQRRLEKAAATDLSLPRALFQTAYGRLFGVLDILTSAARAFARVRTHHEAPTVLVTGEIYVRLDPFANDDLVERLQQRGLRVRLAPLNEWLEYVEQANRWERKPGIDDRLHNFVLQRIQGRVWDAMAKILGWPERTTVTQIIDAAEGLVRKELGCETILTVGAALHEWRHGGIDAAINVGPLECMPCKLAEAQFRHTAEDEGLLALSLPTNGDPIGDEILDNFAFEVWTRYRSSRAERHAASNPTSSGRSTGTGLIAAG